jgi:hypothetical protein
MKSPSLFIIMALLLVACANRQPVITFTNHEDCYLAEKPVVVGRNLIEMIMGKVDEEDIVLLSPDGGNSFIAGQLDDTDGDGIWDELFTLIDLAPGERKAFSIIRKEASEAPRFTRRTNIRFAGIDDPAKEYTFKERLKNSDTETTQKHFQFEGPGWENDVVGFRNYFDARNGMDIWGKTTTEMVLDGVGILDGPSYHVLQDWGMDILKVGNSLGAGAIALKTANGLFRVGPGGVADYHLIAEGPLRSAFDLRFKGIPIDGQLVDINHRISIIAGKPWYKSEITVTGSAGMKLVTGIVNLDSDTVYSLAMEKFSCIYTHDNQAYDGEKLGLALIIPQSKIEAFKAPDKGDGITNTYYTEMEISDKPAVCYFMAGWELQDPRWSDRDSFESGVKQEGDLITVEVEVSKAGVTAR